TLPYESPAERKRPMAEAQGGMCPWCNLPLPADLKRTAIDHIIPRSRGGPNKPWNRQVLHERCNWVKNSALTPEAEKLAAEHGVVLHEPLPKTWPGSNEPGTTGKPNPYRALRPADRPPPPSPRFKVQVTIRKVYEVTCETCQTALGIEDSYEKA